MKSAFLIAIAGALVIHTCLLFGKSESKDALQPVPAQVLPVLSFDAKASIEVRVEFRNTSGRRIQYVRGGRAGQPIGIMEFNLFRDGKQLPPLEQIEDLGLFPDNVRHIEPQGHVPIRLDLSEMYGALKPGRYEVRVKYDVPKKSTLATDLGLTPMSIDRGLLVLEIE